MLTLLFRGKNETGQNVVSYISATGINMNEITDFYVLSCEVG